MIGSYVTKVGSKLVESSYQCGYLCSLEQNIFVAFIKQKTYCLTSFETSGWYSMRNVKQ